MERLWSSSEGRPGRDDMVKCRAGVRMRDKSSRCHRDCSILAASSGCLMGPLALYSRIKQPLLRNSGLGNLVRHRTSRNNDWVF